MTLIRYVGDAYHPRRNAWVSSFFTSTTHTFSDATVGNSSGDTLFGRVDQVIGQYRSSGESVMRRAKQVGSDVKSHVEENKEIYTKAAIGAGVVLTGLVGFKLLQSIGFTKNYGSSKSKIIEKALRQLPLSSLEEIIAKANLCEEQLSVRQQKALRMTINYTRCVRESRDISGRFNAKRRQVITLFASKLESLDVDQCLDEDDGAAEREAENELLAFGLNLNSTDQEISSWLDESDSELEVEEVPPAPEGSNPTSVVTKNGTTFPVSKKHQQFLYDQVRVEMYGSLASNAEFIALRKNLEGQHLIDFCQRYIVDKIPSWFWQKQKKQVWR